MAIERNKLTFGYNQDHILDLRSGSGYMALVDQIFCKYYPSFDLHSVYKLWQEILQCSETQKQFSIHIKTVETYKQMNGAVGHIATL